VYNAINLDVYHYAGNNPVKLVDPDGRLVGIDDAFGWAAGRLFGLRNDNFVSGIAQNFKESWSLIGGMFNTFNGVNTVGGFFKGLGELGFRLTWNLPNELLGVLAGYGAVQFAGAVTEMWDDVQLVKLNSFNNSAFTVGSKVIGQESFLSNEIVRKHEQGHYYQSLLLGPTYIGLIGIPSVMHNWIWNLCDQSWDYDKFYTESWANKLGGVR